MKQRMSKRILIISLCFMLLGSIFLAVTKPALAQIDERAKLFEILEANIVKVDPGRLPTSFWYFVDTVGEWLRLHIFTRAPEKKIETALNYLSEKRYELEKILRQKETKAKSYRKTLARYDKYLGIVLKSKEVLERRGKFPEILDNKLKDNFTRHRDFFGGILEGLPQENQAALEEIIQKLDAFLGVGADINEEANAS